MNPITFGQMYVAALFVGMLLCLELGHRIELRRLAKHPETKREGLGVVEGAVFGLLGLLIAFTFHGAASRFETPRQLVIDEANAISNVWLRVDLLTEDAQPAMRDLLRRYLDARLETYRVLPDRDAAKAMHAEAVNLQHEIWEYAVRVCEANNQPAKTGLVLNPLNAMFDIANTRRQAMRVHPLPVIFVLLFALGLGCAMLAGFGMAGGKTRSWAHIIGFAVIFALSVYVIFELEYPRLGLIRVSGFDRVLVELRGSMD